MDPMGMCFAMSRKKKLIAKKNPVKKFYSIIIKLINESTLKAHDLMNCPGFMTCLVEAVIRVMNFIEFNNFVCFKSTLYLII